MLRNRLGQTSPLRDLERRRLRNTARAGFLKRLARPSPIVSQRRKKRRRMLNPNSFREIAKRAGLKNLVSMLTSPREKMERRLKTPSSALDEESSPAVSQERPWIDQMKKKKRTSRLW